MVKEAVLPFHKSGIGEQPHSLQDGHFLPYDSARLQTSSSQESSGGL